MSTDLLDGARWSVVPSPPGQVTDPSGRASLPAQDRLAATVPGTSAAAVRAAGRGPEPTTHDDLDWWWTTDVEAPPGRYQVQLDGVATHWQLWCDDTLLADGRSMFRPAQVDVQLTGRHRLTLACRSLAAAATPSRPRAPWRSLLVTDPAWRWHRTTPLGRIPWAGTAPVVGPWLPVRLVPVPAGSLTCVATSWSAVGPVDTDAPGGGSVRGRGRVRGTGRSRGTGTVRVSGVADAGALRVEVVLAPTGDDFVGLRLDHPGGEFDVEVSVPDARRWWPRPYGEPEHYRLRVSLDERLLGERLVGFRSVEADRSDAGFALAVNGLPVRARGACWVPPDPFDPGSEVGVEDELARLAGLGATVVRITGTTTPQPPAFHDGCVRLGLMLWHDLMLHTLPPPEDDGWRADFRGEVDDLLRSLQGMPHLAVVCGGSETEQQPTLWGLAPERARTSALDLDAPRVVAEAAPGAVWVSSSPSEGWRPTAIAEGISHYFGVGGYRRPLSDARTAGVRFAAECLALGAPPTRATVREHWGDAAPTPGDPAWREALMADPGADWTFEDVSAHYARELFGIDVEALRAADPDRALDVLRAASAYVMERTLTEWRRPASSCRGAVVLSARDLAPASGWGLLDSAGRPKATWHLVRPVWAPRAVLLTDEGLDGYAVHLVNDTPAAWSGRLEVVANDRRGVASARGEVAATVPPHGATTLWAEQLVRGFRDLAGAWRFGPPGFGTVRASLRDDDGIETTAVDIPAVVLAEVVAETHPPGVLDAALRPGPDGGAELVLRSTVDLAFVSVDAGDEPWFHLPAGAERVVPLGSGDGTVDRPVTVRALNLAELVVAGRG